MSRGVVVRWPRWPPWEAPEPGRCPWLVEPPREGPELPEPEEPLLLKMLFSNGVRICLAKEYQRELDAMC